MGSRYITQGCANITRIWKSVWGCNCVSCFDAELACIFLNVDVMCKLVRKLSILSIDHREKNNTFLPSENWSELLRLPKIITAIVALLFSVTTYCKWYKHELTYIGNNYLIIRTYAAMLKVEIKPDRHKHASFQQWILKIWNKKTQNIWKLT